jgi:hypothetical protein
MPVGLHLYTAILWLLLAALVLAWEWTHPQQRLGRGILGTNFSVAYIAVAFGIYNLARWWVRRGHVRRGPTAEQRWQRWRNARLSTQSRHPEPRDPNFDFTDEPKPPGGA